MQNKEKILVFNMLFEVFFWGHRDHHKLILGKGYGAFPQLNLNPSTLRRFAPPSVHFAQDLRPSVPPSFGRGRVLVRTF